MDNKLKVNLNEYLPLRDVVFNTLRQSILKGEFAPGERLMEKQLAERMGVSRTPIREAIRKLELEGLVVMIPRKGAEVANVSEKDIRDVLVVRATLEGLAVKLACRNMTEDHFDKLKIVHSDFMKAADSGDVTMITEKDIEFHDVLYAASNNDKLISMINNLREQIYRFRVEYINSISDFSQLVDEHKEIINAITNKDPEKAEGIAENHIKNQEKQLLD